MSNLLLSKNEQGIVVFHIWKSLKYKPRLILSFLLIIAGFALQCYYIYVVPGIYLVLVGNLFLLVKGYDTRIKLDSFVPDAEWVKTDMEHLLKIDAVIAKAKKWDKSSIDITSMPGCFIFFIVTALIVLIGFFGPFAIAAKVILISNLCVLMLPHWFSGLKRISSAPPVTSKIDVFKNLIDKTQNDLEKETVSFLMLYNKKNKIPTDVKMKISIKDQPKDFLGFYAQISMNNVQGTSYPYFYVVLVATEKSKLLSDYFEKFPMPKNVIKEFQTQPDIEIVIIRQYTTNTSGYHTNEKAILSIFNTGLIAARKVKN